MTVKVYRLAKTDNRLALTTVPRKSVVDDSVDLFLIGEDLEEYGQELNENMLHLLEKFSAPASPQNQSIPDVNEKLPYRLAHPTNGQIWYNSTAKRIYVWRGDKWSRVSSPGDVAGNSGYVYDGEYIPRPIDPLTGYEFEYSECNFSISISTLGVGQLTEFVCEVSEQGFVTAKIRDGNTGLVPTYANYQVIAIRSA